MICKKFDSYRWHSTTDLQMYARQR